MTQRTTSRAYPAHTAGLLLASSDAFNWPGLLLRSYQEPREKSDLSVPAVDEPMLPMLESGQVPGADRVAFNRYVLDEVARVWSVAPGVIRL